MSMGRTQVSNMVVHLWPKVFDLLALEAYEALGSTPFFLGDYAAALTHLGQGIALTDLTQQRALTFRHGFATGVRCLTYAALTLSCLGSPAQALRRSREALAPAHALKHPASVIPAQHWAAFRPHHRREAQEIQAQADALLTLATEQGFPLSVGYGTRWRGWALAMQDQGEAGLARLRQVMSAALAAGQTLSRPFCCRRTRWRRSHVPVKRGNNLVAIQDTICSIMRRGQTRARAGRMPQSPTSG